MKFTTTYSLTLALGAALLVCATTQGAKHKPVESDAKISKAEATKTALETVPNGTIKEAELEKEKGRLIWSFDISTPQSSDITEVEVDANTGAIVSVHKESAADEAAEAKKEAKHAKKNY
jgi:hypothetical protein